MEVTATAGIKAPRVLVVEDDQAVGETLRRAIERTGMKVCWAQTGAEATTLKASFAPDVVLVDLDLPDMDGVSLIRWLVDQNDCGVIVVSGAGDETDRILGLELGADDYVAKPPNMRELIARVRAVHRRTMGSTQQLPPAPVPPPVGELQVDISRRTAFGRDGQRLSLTGAEYTALEILFSARGEVVTRDKIAQSALHRPWRPEDRSVDQLILSLRQKLGTDSDGQSPIESIRGTGYLLRKSAQLPAG